MAPFIHYPMKHTFQGLVEPLSMGMVHRSVARSHLQQQEQVPHQLGHKWSMLVLEEIFWDQHLAEEYRHFGGGFSERDSVKDSGRRG